MRTPDLHDPWSRVGSTLLRGWTWQKNSKIFGAKKNLFFKKNSIFCTVVDWLRRLNLSLQSFVGSIQLLSLGVRQGLEFDLSVPIKESLKCCEGRSGVSCLFQRPSKHLNGRPLVRLGNEASIGLFVGRTRDHGSLKKKKKKKKKEKKSRELTLPAWRT